MRRLDPQRIQRITNGPTDQPINGLMGAVPDHGMTEPPFTPQA
jgi:hypothetical protein